MFLGDSQNPKRHTTIVLEETPVAVDLEGTVKLLLPLSKRELFGGLSKWRLSCTCPLKSDQTGYPQMTHLYILGLRNHEPESDHVTVMFCSFGPIKNGFPRVGLATRAGDMFQNRGTSAPPKVFVFVSIVGFPFNPQHGSASLNTPQAPRQKKEKKTKDTKRTIGLASKEHEPTWISLHTLK